MRSTIKEKANRSYWWAYLRGGRHESYDFDDRGMTGSAGELGVAGKQRCPQFFGKDDVGGVICRQIVTKLPDARQQQQVRVASNPQVHQILNRTLRTRCGQCALSHQTTQHLSALQIHDFRS